MSRIHAAQKWAARLTVVGLAVVGVQLAATEIASAHTVAVQPTASCLKDNTYTVTWKVTNQWTTLADITVGGHDPSPASSLDKTALTLQPNASGTIVQTGIPAGTKTAHLTTTSVWPSDGTTVGPTTTPVDLSGVCTPTLPKHDATAPSFGNGACVAGRITLPSITIPGDSGVNYTIDNKPVSRGTYTETPGEHTVRASSSTLTLTGATSWMYKLIAAPGNCTTVTPVTPDVTQSSCTGVTPTAPQLVLPSTPGITYLVSKSGPYSAGQTVVVTAIANGNHTLRDSLPSGWKRVSATTAKTTVHFANAANCAQSVTVTKPGFTSAACTPGSASTTPGSYTVPTSKGVQYLVNGTLTKTGTYTAAWGSTVIVMAKALPGYTIKGSTMWKASFPTQTQCADLAGVTAGHTPDTSSNGSAGGPTLANTGVETTPLLIGGIAAIVFGGLLTLMASRRCRSQSV